MFYDQKMRSKTMQKKLNASSENGEEPLEVRETSTLEKQLLM